MRGLRGLAVISALLTAAPAALYSIMMPPSDGYGELDGIERGRRSRSKGKGIRRGKGYVAKPKKHSNRLTISKRVRRKHRRAA